MEYPNWFASTPAQENFSNFLSHLKDRPNLNFLQLGVYTGDATVWLMENVITHDSSTLTDVDTWKGSDEEAHHTMDFDRIFEFYRDRTSKYNPRLGWFRGTTMEFLRYDEEQYDFIYIDADHTAVGVLLDAELSWDLLRPKGILAFDDYQWSDGKGDAYRPMPGINSFLDRHKNELDVVHSGWQLWVIKR
jgi:predicted O-methyltransferase YrrM